MEIFAEVVDENRVVADSARVSDAAGRVAKKFDDGMPAKVAFEMPADSDWFELEVGGVRVKQLVKCGGG